MRRLKKEWWRPIGSLLSDPHHDSSAAVDPHNSSFVVTARRLLSRSRSGNNSSMSLRPTIMALYAVVVVTVVASGVVDADTTPVNNFCMGQAVCDIPALNESSVAGWIPARTIVCCTDGSALVWTDGSPTGCSSGASQVCPDAAYVWYTPPCACNQTCGAANVTLCPIECRRQATGVWDLEPYLTCSSALPNPTRVADCPHIQPCGSNNPSGGAGGAAGGDPSSSSPSSSSGVSSSVVIASVSASISAVAFVVLLVCIRYSISKRRQHNATTERMQATSATGPSSTEEAAAAQV